MAITRILTLAKKVIIMRGENLLIMRVLAKKIKMKLKQMKKKK